MPWALFTQEEKYLYSFNSFFQKIINSFDVESWYPKKDQKNICLHKGHNALADFSGCLYTGLFIHRAVYVRSLLDMRTHKTAFRFAPHLIQVGPRPRPRRSIPEIERAGSDTMNQLTWLWLTLWPTLPNWIARTAMLRRNVRMTLTLLKGQFRYFEQPPFWVV